MNTDHSIVMLVLAAASRLKLTVKIARKSLAGWQPKTPQHEEIYVEAVSQLLVPNWPQIPTVAENDEIDMNMSVEGLETSIPFTRASPRMFALRERPRELKELDQAKLVETDLRRKRDCEPEPASYAKNGEWCRFRHRRSAERLALQKILKFWKLH